MTPSGETAHNHLSLATAELPAELAELADLALDLRWTWSHGADALWRRIDAETWDSGRAIRGSSCRMSSATRLKRAGGRRRFRGRAQPARGPAAAPS